MGWVPPTTYTFNTCDNIQYVPRQHALRAHRARFPELSLLATTNTPVLFVPALGVHHGHCYICATPDEGYRDTATRSAQKLCARSLTISGDSSVDTGGIVIEELSNREQGRRKSGQKKTKGGWLIKEDSRQKTRRPVRQRLTSGCQKPGETSRFADVAELGQKANTCDDTSFRPKPPSDAHADTPPASPRPARLFSFPEPTLLRQTHKASSELQQLSF